MLFWTREEYTKFSEAMMDKPLSFYAFEVLYWCGIREGELLALTPADSILRSAPSPLTSLTSGLTSRMSLLPLRRPRATG